MRAFKGSPDTCVPYRDLVGQLVVSVDSVDQDEDERESATGCHDTCHVYLSRCYHICEIYLSAL